MWSAIWTGWLAWPDGGIWSNLAASLVWSALVWAPSLLHLHRKVERQHRELLDQHERNHQEIRKHLGINAGDSGGQ